MIDFSLMRQGALAFAAAILALALSACAPSAKLADPEWAKYGSVTEPINHDVWDDVLIRHVKASPDGINRFDYAALKADDAAPLKRYLTAMQDIKITQYPRDEQFAYWVNLYNAATVDVIISNYPVKTIREIGPLGLGPWREKIVRVEGKDLSLDDIEHGILRPIWQDVRIHYAVNCASVGCPNLASRAYTGAQLDEMLEAAAAAYINHSRGFTLIDGRLIASSIYDWYGDDWGNQADILAHARKHADRQTLIILQGRSKIDGFDYDWSLNELH